jgi:membrane-bound lytic murein transglycosylase D
MGRHLLRRKILMPKLKSVLLGLLVLIAPAAAAADATPAADRPIRTAPAVPPAAARQTALPVSYEAAGEADAAGEAEPAESAEAAQPAAPDAAAPDPADAADAAGRPLVWHGSWPEALTIDAPDQALVRKYLADYASGAGRQWIEAVAKRGAPYLGFIRSALAARGLPAELAYLPVIESAFSAGAVSKSGAVGLWQFMKNSVAPFGLRIDDWVDERKDFWKATDAALRKLAENYRYFGDWPLALAAYNAGLGAVQRAVSQAGSKDYWELCRRGFLKAETVNYVPKFIAASTVLSRAGRYGLDLGWAEDPAWTRVKTGKSIDLGLLSEYSGVPIERLRQANPELRHGITPPDKDYALKVRSADAAAVAAVVARTDVQLIRYYFHIVKSGDTLSALARHYGVSVEAIERSNPGVRAQYLQLGQKLLVPAFKEVGPYVGDAPNFDDADLVFNGQYQVKKGDTLWSIALAYDVDPEILAAANGMELSAILREGRTLKTPIR